MYVSTCDTTVPARKFMPIRCTIFFVVVFLLTVACAAKKSLPPDRAAAQPIRPVAPSLVPAPSFLVNGQTPQDADQAFNVALEAFKAQNGDAALLQCRNVQERFPRTSWYKRALFLSEQTLIRMDRPSEAAAVMLRVRAEYPDMADYAVYLLADYFFAQSRFSEAAALYGVLVQKYPKSSLVPRSEFRRAAALLESYAYAQAVDALTAFLDVYPDSELAPEAGIALGRALTAEARLTEAVQAYQEVWIGYAGAASDVEAERALAALAAGGVTVPEITADQLYERGKNLSKPNLYDKAVEVFTKLLEKNPPPARRADIMVRTGIALFNLNRRADAAAMLEKMVNSYPSDARTHEALYWLGRSHSKLGDWEKGVKIFQKLLERFPESEWADDALFLMGTIYREAGDMKKALRCYNRLGVEYPASKYADSAVWWRAWALFLSGEYRKAEQTLQELINTYPRSFLVNQARYWQGRAAEKAGKPARAMVYYEQVLRNRPFTYYGFRAGERKNSLASSGADPASYSAEEGADVCKTASCSDDLMNDYDLDEGPPVWTEETKQILTAEPSFKKTLELMSLNMKKDAARELWLLQTAKPRKRGMLIGLSKAFFELGDYGRSLQLVLRNYERYLDRPRKGTPDDLWLLAYPQGYWESILFHSRKYGQDPYFVAAIIREESQFSSDALSPAGARGLMQVMPSTGEWVAKRIKIDGFGREKLFDSDMAIHIGTWYISHLMKQFRGDPLLTAAAYNAGPDAVSGWIAKYGYNGERDAFVEAIPFSETRGYVKKVLRNYNEYKRIYGRTGLVADTGIQRSERGMLHQD
jgi:soluble lytic murein transglycosylase